MGVLRESVLRPTREALDRADPVKQRQLKVPELRPEEAQSTLGWLGDQTLQAVDSLAYVLGTPTAIATSVAMGALGGDPGNPFGSSRDRVTGEELLEQAGLAPKTAETTLGHVAKKAAGFGVEVAIDPLAWLSGPAKALTDAGRAARATGLLDNAQAAASKAALAAGTAADTAVGRNTLKAFAREGVPLTEATVAARPLVGRRMSYRTQTIDDLLDTIDDPVRRAQEMDKLQQHVPAGMTFDQLRTQRLGKTLGIGLPLGESQVAFDILGSQGGDALAGAMDLFGEAAAWSPAGRFAGQWTNKDLAGSYHLADQVEALRVAQKTKAASREAAAKGARLAVDAKFAKIPPAIAKATGVHDLFSKEGNNALLRLVELDPSRWNAMDQALHSAPDVQRLAQFLRDQSDEYLRRSAEAGIRADHLKSRFGGINYFPRQLTSAELADAGRSGADGKVFSVTTPDMLSRTTAFDVPGGVSQLRELSLDQAMRAQLDVSDDAAATYILQAINDPTGTYTRDDALELARSFRKMPQDSIDAGLGYFGQHPIDAFADYFAGREKAIATAKAKTESLADYIVRGSSGAHASHSSAQDAIHKAGLTAATTAGGPGADTNLKQLIWDRMPANSRPPSWQGVDLTQFSVPDTLIQRLGRASLVVDSPEAIQSVANVLSSVTRLWKSSVLTWPSRYVRDRYSGMMSNYLETGDVGGMIFAARSAGSLLRGDYGTFGRSLAEIPRYASIAKASGTEEALKQFLTDAGAVRIMSGTSIEDLPTAIGTGRTSMRGIPGGEPETVSAIFGQELASKAGRSWGQFGRDLGTVNGVFGAPSTKNPILRVGERLGDLVDGTNRLEGYLTLLRQGVDPTEAAARIGRAQVDYGSLTELERRTIRAVFPFWAYQSRMGKYVGASLLSRPGGRYGQMIRGLSNVQRSEEGEYVPTSIREQFGFRTETTDEGNYYLTDPDLPGVDQIALLKIAPSGYPDAARTLMGVGQMMNPIARGALEHVTGTNFFYRRPLGQDENGLDRVLEAAGIDPRANPLRTMVNTAISMSPFSRVDSLARNILDPKQEGYRHATNLLINNTLGFKERFKAFDEEYRDAADKIRSGDLEAYGREVPTWYIPDEDLTNLTPDQYKRYQLYKMLDRYQRAVSKAKREGEPLPQMPF